MRFIFYTNVAFEDWDYENGIKKGIGGSETSIVEMSWRLARRGHEVIVYAPIKKTTVSQWRGTTWKRYEKADFSLKGVWILYRCPDVVDKFLPRKKGQTFWLLWQDWDYPQLTKKRVQGVDKHITLCKAHGLYMVKRYPVGGRVWLSSNGIKLDLIEQIEKEKIKRTPHRMMYASSPDRGLLQALQVFKIAKEYVPDLEFHAYYGFNNLNKLIKNQPTSSLARVKDEIMPLLKQDGVFFHGRINQEQLMREWFKSGIYIYITDFFETSHISGMEAQACGAVPVFSPIYAQKENIKHGIGVEGRSKEPLTIARAASEVVRLCLTPGLQEQIRKEMMPWARDRFNWEVFVKQWISEAEGKRKDFEAAYAFPEQLIKESDSTNINKDFNFKKKPFEQYTQEFMGNVKGLSVLDIGGYDGKQAEYALQKGASEATVIDNGSWKIYQDWPEFEKLKGVQYINDDVLNYKKKADIVICQNVIYHTRNPWLVIEKLRNLTKKKLIISTSYIKGNSQTWKVYKPYQGHPVSWTVAWRPTISGLKAVLEANGFKIVREEKKRGHIVMECNVTKPMIGFHYENKLMPNL
jgi:glycosyltransferase involved in cell wall biosynthesis